jgi:type VI secretion system secreted protein VgrG
VWSLRPGYLFQLEQHPRAGFNASYLTVSAEHWGKQIEGADVIDTLLGLPDDTAYAVEIAAIEGGVQFRAERSTAWPRIDGVVDGVIDGNAESPYAQIDEHGRYKVRIFFDESDLLDGSASTWVRMLQPHGGGTEGMHFPLRKGTEVHMVFLGGDPDRPIIVGVAPNAQKPSKVIAGNFSQNVIMTGGSNRLELEDSDGGQYVTMSTPTEGSYLHMGAGDYNFVAHTLGHGQEFVGGNKDGEVVGNMTEKVTGSLAEDYQSSKSTNVVGPVAETYAASHDRSVTGPVTFKLDSTLSETIQGAVNRSVMGTFDENIAGAVTLHYQATLDETIDGDVTTTTANVTEVHNGDKNTTITGTHSIDAAGAQHFHSYASQQMTAPAQEFTADGAQLMKSDTHTVEASSAASVNAPTVTINGDGSVTISGASITIQGGDVTMEGGTLNVSHGATSITGSPITVNGGGNIDMTAGLIKLNS